MSSLGFSFTFAPWSIPLSQGWLIKATTDEKVTAAKKEREACAAHAEEVFCDWSAPAPLKQAYRTVTEAIRNRGRR
jgi:hypothetical protein